MSTIVVDLQELYTRTFGGRPKVGALSPIESNEPRFQIPAATPGQMIYKDGSVLQSIVNGTEIWLPTTFSQLDNETFEGGKLDLPYTVISIRGAAEWIKTPLTQRKGTVKELFNIEDYQITLKGFFIDLKNRTWPYDDLVSLKKVYEAGMSFELNNALTNIFLQEEGVSDERRVVMSSFELLPVEGGRKHCRPFVIQLESDNVFTLELA